MIPSLVNKSATWTLVTEPNIFPFSPTFAGTLNVFLVSLASVAVASSLIFTFFSALCFYVSACIFLIDVVAKTAKPLGIR